MRLSLEGPTVTFSRSDLPAQDCHPFSRDRRVGQQKWPSCFLLRPCNIVTALWTIARLQTDIPTNSLGVATIAHANWRQRTCCCPAVASFRKAIPLRYFVSLSRTSYPRCGPGHRYDDRYVRPNFSESDAGLRLSLESLLAFPRANRMANNG